MKVIVEFNHSQDYSPIKTMVHATTDDTKASITAQAIAKIKGILGDSDAFNTETGYLTEPLSIFIV